jgi:hypothetical protein
LDIKTPDGEKTGGLAEGARFVVLDDGALISQTRCRAF